MLVSHLSLTVLSTECALQTALLILFHFCMSCWYSLPDSQKSFCDPKAVLTSAKAHTANAPMWSLRCLGQSALCPSQALFFCVCPFQKCSVCISLCLAALCLQLLQCPHGYCKTLLHNMGHCPLVLLEESIQYIKHKRKDCLTPKNIWGAIKKIKNKKSVAAP